MKTRILYKYLVITVLIFSLFCCQGQKKSGKKSKKDKNAPPPQEQFDKTIGQLTEAMAFNPIPVKGIGLVVGLSATGSSDCPPDSRDYLRQYILAQIGEKHTIDPDTLINSKDTAVVLVEGLIPPAAVVQDSFDIRVSALPKTQTTSLEGGRLYTCDLKLVSQVEETISATKRLAIAAGTVYIDNIADKKPDQRTGYVFGGGKSLQDHQIMLAILNPDFQTAATIRDRINGRFGRNTANAASDSIIYLNLPDKFKERKLRFIELVKSLYIGRTPQSDAKHLDVLIDRLTSAPAADKEKAETGLEAVGKPAVGKLLPLLDSRDALVRFVAARCLSYIGEDKALKYLRDVAQDSKSPYRIPAIIAIGETADKQDILVMMGRLVRDDDLNTRYVAYKYLAKYNDSSIIQTPVSNDFYIDQVIENSPKTVYVSRRDEPRIVLFGAPVECEKNIFIDSGDGRIIINALPDENQVSILRKHPVTGELMGPLKTSYKLADIIRTLGGQPEPQDRKDRMGLGVPYSQIVELLKKMCEKGAVKAEFVAGPLTSLAQMPSLPERQKPPTPAVQPEPQKKKKSKK